MITVSELCVCCCAGPGLFLREASGRHNFAFLLWCNVLLNASFSFPTVSQSHDLALPPIPRQGHITDEVLRTTVAVVGDQLTTKPENKKGLFSSIFLVSLARLLTCFVFAHVLYACLVKTFIFFILALRQENFPNHFVVLFHLVSMLPFISASTFHHALLFHRRRVLLVLPPSCDDFFVDSSV